MGRKVLNFFGIPLISLFFFSTSFIACSHLKLENTSASFLPTHRQQAKDNDRVLSSIIKKSQTHQGQIDPLYMKTQADYYFTLGEAHSLENSPIKALENYKLALIYDKDSSHIHYRMALEFVKLGLISQAVAECERAIGIDPSHKDSSLLLGGLLSAMNIFDSALGVYQKALKHYPDDFEISLFIGMLYGEKGDFDKAIEHFRKMALNKKLNKNPDGQSKVWYYLGQAYMEKPKPNFKNAESAYMTSLAIKPNTQTVLALGEIYEFQNENKKLEKLLSGYQKNQNKDPLIAEKLSQIYIKNNQLGKALEQLKIIESQDDKFLNVSFKIALILIEQKKFNMAIKKLSSLLKKTSGSEKIHFYLGSLYEQVKDYPSAIESFNHIPPSSRYYQDSVIHASYLYQLTGKPGKAIQKAKEGLEQKNKSPNLWIFYASLLKEQNQLDKVQKTLSSALKIFPENKNIHFQLGSTYDLMGEKNKSIKHLEKVLYLDENHVQALNHLAYIYADMTLNLNTAETLAKKAIQLEPDNGFILDTLGWILFKQNRFKEAIEILEKAHEKESNESLIAEHLGDAYFHHKKPTKAKLMYEKAMRLEKSQENKNKILSKLNSIQEKKKKDNKTSRVPASKIE